MKHEVWSGSLKLKFEVEDWHWSVELAFDAWSIKLKFEVELLSLQFEIEVYRWCCELIASAKDSWACFL